MKIVVVASGGGSSAETALLALQDLRVPFELLTIVDRECGAETVLSKFGQVLRLDESENRSFSTRAAERIRAWGGADAVLLLYTRLVTSELYASWPTLNVHESLLPAYKGFGAVQNALVDRLPYFGATLHRVTEAMDGGPILAQAIHAVPHDASIEWAVHVMHTLKVGLILRLFEAMVSQDDWIDQLMASRSSEFEPINPRIGGGFRAGWLGLAKEKGLLGSIS